MLQTPGKNRPIRACLSVGILWGICVVAGVALVGASGEQAAAQSVSSAQRLVEALPLARFLSSLPDVPLMPGFEEMEADLTLFDKPDGRIAQAYALGPDMSFGAVTDYYKTILPRFGWVSGEPGVFFRNAERLSIETARARGKGVIRYTLAPVDRPAGADSVRKP